MHVPRLICPVAVGVAAGLLVAIADLAWDVAALASLGVVALLVVLTGRRV